ncbi:predicted protein [Sclerotinia sclerotiorum 1980 UF-70]|uniref:Uncharacterized protein n=1 Tax=Sclerotinia sclerotiorum (strain ATCC 18683 / 1980 / Ss-1) TaxID=665079 RepID=A7ECD7_SCLS1|nr:predicted protein [Sclerotinia sclerotiorum 1980 UF-70]EDO00116.1 predicted protein [Sclerotinia sclerotiorum 1980 UF-70]
MSSMHAQADLAISLGAVASYRRNVTSAGRLPGVKTLQLSNFRILYPTVPGPVFFPNYHLSRLEPTYTTLDYAALRPFKK